MLEKNNNVRGVDSVSKLILALVIVSLCLWIFIINYKLWSQKKLIVDLTKWHEIALTDSLTGIPNRAAYSSHIEKLKDNKVDSNVAIILFDIDDFKHINDTCGHLWGDKVLQDCAKMLCEVYSQSGCYVYRIGGDEFAAICENMPESYIIESLLEIRRYEVQKIDFKLSKGYSFLNGKKDFSNMFNRADEMLYVDKASKSSHEKHFS